jgi:hypothetical protein
MRGSIWAVLVVAILVLVIAVGFGSAYDSAISTQEADNRSVAVKYAGPVSAVNGSEVVEIYDNESVYNSSDAKLEEGVDYDWNETSGNVSFFDTNATTSGEQASVTFYYRDRPQTTEHIMALIIGVLPALRMLFLMVVGGTLLVVAVAAFGGSGF